MGRKHFEKYFQSSSEINASKIQLWSMSQCTKCNAIKSKHFFTHRNCGVVCVFQWVRDATRQIQRCVRPHRNAFVMGACLRYGIQLTFQLKSSTYHGIQHHFVSIVSLMSIEHERSHRIQCGWAHSISALSYILYIYQWHFSPFRFFFVFSPIFFVCRAVEERRMHRTVTKMCGNNGKDTKNSLEFALGTANKPRDAITEKIL